MAQALKGRHLEEEGSVALELSLTCQRMDRTKMKQEEIPTISLQDAADQARDTEMMLGGNNDELKECEDCGGGRLILRQISTCDDAEPAGSC